jgi:hypothetical protein
MTRNTRLRVAVLGLAAIVTSCSSDSSHLYGDAAGGAAGTSGWPNGSAGTTGTSGVTAAGGMIAYGGTNGSGASTGMGGLPAPGGATGAGGLIASGGTIGASGGASGSGGSAGTLAPCDIYQSGNTPCVAAHSTVRALYAAYGGNLYQVRRASDQSTKDIAAMSPGGFADSAAQDTFCAGTTCTISIIYDQSSQGNHLQKSPTAYWLPNGGKEAPAAAGKITVGSHTAYGVYVSADSVAYRLNSTKGIATGDQPEAMYMVVDGKRNSGNCCFDYGNAETSGKDDGNGTMEAVYWGTDTTWGGRGDGNGPWIAADLENGMFKSDKGGWQSQSVYTPSAKSVIVSYATAMLKGPSGNHFTLKAADAQSGTLITMWDGVRPSPGYSPKKLQGAIILGTGGDGSNGGTGTFFEGAMTAGNPSDSVDEQIQANIVAAGYGR